MTTTRKRQPVITVHVGGRRRRRRSHKARAGFAAALWTMFAALFSMIAVLFDLISLITAVLIVGIVAAVSGIAALIAARHGGQGGGGTTGSHVNPRNMPPPGVQTPRRKPVAGTRARACGKACQTSRVPNTPEHPCDCSCGGANHGRLVGRTAPPRPTKRARTTKPKPSTGSGAGGGPKTSTRKGEKRCTRCGRTVPTTVGGRLMSHNCKVEAFRRSRRRTL